MRIRGLDGLRGAAILMVLFWHVIKTVSFPGARTLQITQGWMGVDLFFALSGFLITRLILDEEQATGSFSLGRFCARRALRIWPAFYAVLLLDIFVLGHVWFVRSAHLGNLPALGTVSLATFWSNYYLQMIAPATHVGLAYAVFWSLCVEEHFYVLWPLALKLLPTPKARLVLAVAVCAGEPLLRLALRIHGVPAVAVHFLSHTRLDAILAGCLAALFFEPLAARPRLRRALLGTAGAGVVAAVASGDLEFPPTLLGASAAMTALAAACALLVAEVAAVPSSRLTRALEVGPLAAVGRVSYGMYLLHFQMIDFARELVGYFVPSNSAARGWVIFALALALSFGTAALLQRLVETPFLRLRSRLRTPARKVPVCGRAEARTGALGDRVPLESYFRTASEVASLVLPLLIA